MAISLGFPKGATVRVARSVYEGLWCSEGCDLCDAERAFYDSCSDDEWQAFIEARLEVECDC